MTPSEILRPTSLADELASRIERGILDGEFPPGTHLLQDELCARFGVSRTPVREALRKLQAQHLVVLTPSKGATVRVPSRLELEEVSELRAELEGWACELAAKRMTDAGLERLWAAYRLIAAAYEVVGAGKVAEEREASLKAEITRGNDELHDAILELAGNGQLREVCRSLQAYFPKDYVWRAITASDDGRALSLDDHRAIIEALAAGKGAAARKAMVAHVRRGGVTLIAYLAERRFWDQGT